MYGNMQKNTRKQRKERMSEQAGWARGYLPGGEALGGESARVQNKRHFPFGMEIKRLLISAGVCFFG